MTATTVMAVGGAPLLISAAPITPEEATQTLPRDPDLPVDYMVIVDLVVPPELAEAGFNPSPIKEIWGSKAIYLYDPEGNRLEFWAGRAKA